MRESVPDIALEKAANYRFLGAAANPLPIKSGIDSALRLTSAYL
tara:strand:- start:7226 stop:7357 length:132 start_codon:yes stop_codon:yes gene_type:complete